MNQIKELTNSVICGDCLEVMKDMPDNSVDSIVTDPPYELGFMGKKWDSTGIANNVEMWKECLRVLKPGGHLLAFSGTRTYHRMACAIEDAGFEVRDMIEWVYGSGFPKSLNISKAIEATEKYGKSGTRTLRQVEQEGNGESYELKGKNNGILGETRIYDRKKYFPQGTAKQWEGWGTALKPAHEPICMARKPLSEKTVAENCLKWGTGGINIDESRVAANWKEERPESWFNSGKSKSGEPTYDGNLKSLTESTVGERLHDGGRFPANLIHDNSEEVRECFPEQKSGKRSSTYEIGNDEGEMFNHGIYGKYKAKNYDDVPASSGNASRFFKSIIYQAKASKSERNRGCEELEEKDKAAKDFRPNHAVKAELGEDGNPFGRWGKIQNNHPTVKPIALMEYLIKMVTPKGGIVLDPFAGSGSTLVAAKQNGFDYVGIEITEEYIPIIEARLNVVDTKLKEKSKVNE